MNEQELNKKLAEWAEARHWSPWTSDSSWSEEIPNFTQSLDACFKWLVPKLKKHRITLVCDYDKTRCYVTELFGSYVGHLAGGKTPALALCLAIEKLIESGRTK